MSDEVLCRCIGGPLDGQVVPRKGGRLVLLDAVSSRMGDDGIMELTTDGVEHVYNYGFTESGEHVATDETEAP